MNDLNPIQMSILKELLFKPNSRFTNLNEAKISSDQFSYHLRSLIELGLVEKKDGLYVLTLQGKEFANRMDTAVNKIEKQPKVSVLIVPIKIVKGKKMYLISTRLKEPYYGFKGFMTGKIRFGETVEEAAQRELMEETGLKGKIKHCFVLHEMVYKKDGEMLEDKFFNIMEATPKYHNEEEIFGLYKKGKSDFMEKKYYIDSF